MGLKKLFPVTFFHRTPLHHKDCVCVLGGGAAAAGGW